MIGGYELIKVILKYTKSQHAPKLVIQAAKFIPALEPLPGMFTQILTGSGSAMSLGPAQNATFHQEDFCFQTKVVP